MFTVTILYSDHEDNHTSEEWLSFRDAIRFVDGLDDRGVHVILRNNVTGSIHGFPSHLFIKEVSNA